MQGREGLYLESYILCFDGVHIHSPLDNTVDHLLKIVARFHKLLQLFPHFPCLNEVREPHQYTIAKFILCLKDLSNPRVPLLACHCSSEGEHMVIFRSIPAHGVPLWSAESPTQCRGSPGRVTNLLSSSAHLVSTRCFCSSSSDSNLPASALHSLASLL